MNKKDKVDLVNSKVWWNQKVFELQIKVKLLQFFELQPVLLELCLQKVQKIFSI